MGPRNRYWFTCVLCVLALVTGATEPELPEIVLYAQDGSLTVPLAADRILGQSLIARMTPPAGDGISLQLIGKRGSNGFRNLGSGEETRIGPEVAAIALRLSAPEARPPFERELSISFFDDEKILVGRTRFRLRVAEKANPWIEWLLAALGAAVFGTAFLLAGNTMTHSRFLPPPKKIVEHMHPQICEITGAWTRDGREARNPLPQIQKALQPQQRILNWIRSNPLSFCLPGREYTEALVLDLMMPVHASLVRGCNLKRQIRENPKRWRGRLLAIATRTGGVSFLAIPDNRGRVGNLRLEHRRKKTPVTEGTVQLSHRYRLMRRPQGAEQSSNAWKLTSF